METSNIDPTLMQRVMEQVHFIAGKLPLVMIIIVGIWVLSRLVVRIVIGAGKLTKADPAIVLLISSSIRFVLWVFGLTGIFGVLGFNQIALTLGGTVALVGMSLATGLNSIPQDLLAGIFLITDEDFKVGRQVKTGAFEGWVKQVTIRKTKLVDAEGKLHVVPNRVIDQATYTIYPKKPKDEAEAKGA